MKQRDAEIDRLTEMLKDFQAQVLVNQQMLLFF